jgi:hypothetical protein
MVSVIDRGFEPRSGQIKYYEIGICFFPAKYALVRIMCPSGETCLSADCWFSELALWKSN